MGNYQVNFMAYMPSRDKHGSAVLKIRSHCALKQQKTGSDTL